MFSKAWKNAAPKKANQLKKDNKQEKTDQKKDPLKTPANDGRGAR